MSVEALIQFCDGGVLVPKLANLQNDGMQRLAKALKNNTTVRCLDLCGKGLKVWDLSPLMEALTTNTALQFLNLRSNEIGLDGLSLICQFLKGNPALSALDLSRIGMDDEGARTLAEAIKVNTRLSVLRFNDNALLSPEGTRCLCEALAINKTLVSVGFSGNNLGDEGASAMAQVIKQRNSLAFLDLSNNGIGPTGAHHLAESLCSNSSISVMRLCGNPLREEGAKHLANALKLNTSLLFLDLACSKIFDGSLPVLVDALSSNSSLIMLNLSNNVITPSKASLFPDFLRTVTSSADFLLVREQWDARVRITVLPSCCNRLTLVGTSYGIAALDANTPVCVLKSGARTRVEWPDVKLGPVEEGERSSTPDPPPTKTPGLVKEAQKWLLSSVKLSLSAPAVETPQEQTSQPSTSTITTTTDDSESLMKLNSDFLSTVSERPSTAGAARRPTSRPPSSRPSSSSSARTNRYLEAMEVKTTRSYSASARSHASKVSAGNSTTTADEEETVNSPKLRSKTPPKTGGRDPSSKMKSVSTSLDLQRPRSAAYSFPRAPKILGAAHTHSWRWQSTPFTLLATLPEVSEPQRYQNPKDVSRGKTFSTETVDRLLAAKTLFEVRSEGRNLEAQRKIETMQNVKKKSQAEIDGFIQRQLESEKTRRKRLKMRQAECFGIEYKSSSEEEEEFEKGEGTEELVEETSRAGSRTVSRSSTPASSGQKTPEQASRPPSAAGIR